MDSTSNSVIKSGNYTTETISIDEIKPGDHIVVRYREFGAETEGRKEEIFNQAIRSAPDQITIGGGMTEHGPIVYVVTCEGEVYRSGPEDSPGETLVGLDSVTVSIEA